MSTKDKKDINEEMFDHMIKYGTSEWADDISPDDIPEEDLSDQLNQKMDTMFASARKKANRKRRFVTARRVAAVFLVFLTMASITVMSVEAFREPVLNFIFKTTNKADHTRLDITESTDTPTEIDYSFNYIPKGYIFKQRVIDNSNTNISYEFQKREDSILIDIILDPSITIYKYLEGQQYKTIKTSTTKYFYVEGDYNQLIWTKNKTIYTIYSKFKSDNMITIAENIKCKK